MSSNTSGGISEFLNELGETESLAALREAHSQQSPFVFKIDEYPTPQKVSIANFLDKRAILDAETSKMQLPENREISFKFNIGTEVYFVKTTLKSHLNRYYFDMSSKVIQLKRRKEPRFMIPKKWNQSASIVNLQIKGTSFKCLVHDISLSGIRFEMLEGVCSYKRDDIIHIKFQIYKRGEVSTSAIVRFVLVRPNANPLLGIEFAQISDVNSQRVADIIEDIRIFHATTK